MSENKKPCSKCEGTGHQAQITKTGIYTTGKPCRECKGTGWEEPEVPKFTFADEVETNQKEMIYICHRYGDNPEENEKHVLEVVKAIKRLFPEIIPMAPQIYLPRFYDENTEREDALRACLAILSTCSQMWIEVSNPEITAGMRGELRLCEKIKITVQWFRLNTDGTITFLQPVDQEVSSEQ